MVSNLSADKSNCRVGAAKFCALIVPRSVLDASDASKLSSEAAFCAKLISAFRMTTGLLREGVVSEAPLIFPATAINQLICFGDRPLHAHIEGYAPIAGNPLGGVDPVSFGHV